MSQQKSMDEIVALCKRRGFIFPASEIYGGINGFWDYGPLGIALKNNIRDLWWRDMVLCPPMGPDGELLSMVGLDSSIVQNPKIWEASGHVAGFNDPMVDCRETKSRYRADHLVVLKHPERDDIPMFAYMGGGADDGGLKKRLKKQGRGVKFEDLTQTPFTEISPDEYDNILGPDASEPGTLTEPREFNLMFKTYVGAIQSEDSVAYLRPETAQGIFLNYKNVLDTMRVKVPFGIAQVGKAFRNEVTPRNFIFRSREFEQMEMEWFCHPDDAKQWFEFWSEARMAWWKSLGLDGENLKFREHDSDELAHYAKEGHGTFDVEYRFPFTYPDFTELEGIAHRSNFDLAQHQQHSKTKLEYFDQERNERYLPHVIEPAAGLSRAVLAVLCEAYTPDPERPSKVFMKFKPSVAPIKAAVFPLVNKDGMPEVAKRLYLELRQKFVTQYDAKQSIGKRYARMDEAGTPYCFTVDSDSLSDNTVTVRERDTATQSRISMDEVESFLAERVS